MIAWRFDGPNESFGFWHTFNVTAPIRLMLHSGEIQDVTTPAGTFSSIPVRVALPTIDRLTTDDREGPVVGLGGDECGRPRLAAEAWVSGDVGNVVKAVTFLGGVRSVPEVASFHPGPSDSPQHSPPSLRAACRGGGQFSPGALSA